jgi:hypothetical protein
MDRFRRANGAREAASSAATERRVHLGVHIALALAAVALCAFLAPAAAFGVDDPSDLELEAITPAPGQWTFGTGAPDVLVTLPWGDADGQVGLLKTTEGLTRGPEALAVASDGRIAILDSVNDRLVLLDKLGSQLGTIGLDLSEPRFLAVDDRVLYVLDAEVERRLATYSWSGGQLSLAAMPLFDDVVTGLFATTQGPCVEIAHRTTLLLTGGLRLAAMTGGVLASPTTRELQGRPLDSDMNEMASATYDSANGVRVQAAALDSSGLQIASVDGVQPVLASGSSVEHLVSLDGDGHGGLLIGARLSQPETHGSTQCTIAITRIAGSTSTETDGTLRLALKTTASVLCLAESGFAYLGQPYVVAPDGRVYQPVSDADGYSILVHTFPGVQS